jgi:hypothetical protein
MYISAKNRKIEWFVTMQTMVLIIITTTTFLISENSSNWLCGPALLFFELVAFFIQSILNILVWLILKKSIKIIFFGISLSILLLVIAGFLQFYFNCS